MLKRISLFLITIISLAIIAGCQMGQSGPTNSDKYTVTFDCGIECQIEDVKVEKGGLVKAPANPVREGYIFLGWYDGKVLWDFENYTVTKNITLTAKWEKEHVHEFIEGKCECGETDPDYVEPHEHEFVNGKCECGETDPNKTEFTLSFNTDGGTNIDDIVLTVGEKVEAPTNPTKEGHTFKGWEPELPSEMPSYDFEVKAIWEANMYTIKFNTGAGSSVETLSLKYGETLPKVDSPVRAGYDFVGWNAKLPETMPAKNLTFTAVWEGQIKSITYILNDGSFDDSYPKEFKVGEGLTLPTPVRSGYTFKGWYYNAECTGSSISKISTSTLTDVTIYAKWEEITGPVVGDPFEVSFELNGGAWTWTTGTVSAPANGIDSVSNLPEIFMADFYTYLFDNNLLNSSKVASKLQVSTWAGFSTKYGDPVAWYNATSTGGYAAADGYSELFFDSVNGYEVVGGFLGTSPYKEKYANLTKHILQLTLARYTLATTSASFKGAVGFVLDGYFYGTQGLLADSKANAATFNALRATIPTPTVGYEETTETTNEYLVSTGVYGTPLKLVAPVREGYMFLGWYDNPECTGAKVTEVSSGCTVYASWFNLNGPAPTYKINYVLNGGENSSDNLNEYSFGEGLALSEPVREGYTFIGWTSDAEGKNKVTSISEFTKGDITLYANWVEGADEVYTITYIYTDGKLPTYNPTTIQEVAEYVFTSYYNWYKPGVSYETFKSNVIAQWKDKQAQGIYKFYKQNGQGTIDDDYFCNATENFEEWNAWFTVFDSLVTAANGAQNAWNSYVGILRLGQVLSGNAPTTWKADFNTTLCKATNIAIPLVTEYELGDEIILTELVINDGRTFLGWYDENGNKVEKITSTTEGDLVLTARWSEAIPVESFVVTNEIERLLKLSEHQLSWIVGPENATFKKVTFSSTDTNVLTVSDSGLIKAIGVGVAKVLITVHGNTDLNIELEIEVYIDPYIDGEFTGASYVVANESIQLNAKLVGKTSSELVWTSKNPTIANVSTDGLVSGIREGVAEIVVSCADDESISFTFYVTVFAEDPTDMLKLLADSNNSEIYMREDLLIGIKIGSDGAYYADILGSVSKLLFEEYVVHDDYYLSNPSNKSSYSSGGVQFITVHYAADMPYAPSATFNGGKNLASYNQSCNNNGTSASWHYSVGNDGIWACQNESYGAWHAGSSKTMTWTDSGLTIDQVGSDLYTTDVTMGTDGYFYIKGVKTAIKNTSSGTKLNGLGLAVKVEGNKVYLGGHYQNSSYNYISSTGGNNNSIGMETSVREGSDLWLTWQYTAQLCAKLLIKYDLPLNRLVGHHFFSGKWCPQPMLENDLEIWYEFVELTRQQMELYKNYSDYTLTFESSSEYLDDNGRVVKLPDYPECVTYTVTYSNGTTTKTATFSTILPGILE